MARPFSQKKLIAEGKGLAPGILERKTGGHNPPGGGKKAPWLRGY